MVETESSEKVKSSSMNGRVWMDALEALPAGTRMSAGVLSEETGCVRLVWERVPSNVAPVSGERQSAGKFPHGQGLVP